MPSGITHRVIVKSPEGLHLRPADQLVRMAGRYQSNVRIGKLPSHLTADGDAGCASAAIDVDDSGIGFGSPGELLDCKSILSLMTLGAAQGDVLTLYIDGPDAPDALDVIKRWFDSGFADYHDPNDGTPSPIGQTPSGDAV